MYLFKNRMVLFKDLYNLYDSFNFSHQILMSKKAAKVQDNSKVDLNRKPEPPNLLNKVKFILYRW